MNTCQIVDHTCEGYLAVLQWFGLRWKSSQKSEAGGKEGSEDTEPQVAGTLHYTTLALAPI